jgi:hypothetical protein
MPFEAQAGRRSPPLDSTGMTGDQQLRSRFRQTTQMIRALPATSRFLAINLVKAVRRAMLEASMIDSLISPYIASSRRGPGIFAQKHRPLTHRNTSSVPFSPATPISPPSGPTQWLLQGPPAESNLLAANLGKAAWRATLALNENYREISRVSRLPARTGDFSYRNTAH